MSFLYHMCFTRPRYQVSVYRTTGPLVSLYQVQRVAFLLQLNFSVLVVLTGTLANFKGQRSM